MNLGVSVKHRMGLAVSMIALAGSTVLVPTPASAKVTITPDQHSRSRYSIFPWQKVDLAFPIRYTGTIREVDAMRDTLVVVRRVIRKKGMTYPLYGRYIRGSNTGSGTYTMTATWQYATDYRLVPRYKKQTVMETSPVTCTLVRSDGRVPYSHGVLAAYGRPSPITGGSWRWHCAAAPDEDLEQFLSSPYFLGGESSSSWPGAVFPGIDSDTAVWTPRPVGSPPCADGTQSSDQTTSALFCVEDLVALPRQITATLNSPVKKWVENGTRREYTHWRKTKVSKTYQISVKSPG